MKKLLLSLAILIGLSAPTLSLKAATITFALETGWNEPTNLVTIKPNEIATIAYTSVNTAVFRYIRDGKSANVTTGAVLAGPGELTVYSNSGFFVVTLVISPESFPPDKTIIIPEGTTGATITLECSTNLVNWSAATNGFYSATNNSKFFRIRAEREP